MSSFTDTTDYYTDWQVWKRSQWSVITRSCRSYSQSCAWSPCLPDQGETRSAAAANETKTLTAVSFYSQAPWSMTLNRRWLRKMECASVPVIWVILPWKQSIENAWINSVNYHFFTNGKISRWNFIPLIVFFLYYTSVSCMTKEFTVNFCACFVLFVLKQACFSTFRVLWSCFRNAYLKLCNFVSYFLLSLYNTAKLSQPRWNMAASIRGEKKAVNSERLHQRFVWLCTVLWGQSW